MRREARGRVLGEGVRPTAARRMSDIRRRVVVVAASRACSSATPRASAPGARRGRLGDDRRTAPSRPSSRATPDAVESMVLLRPRGTRPRRRRRRRGAPRRTRGAGRVRGSLRRRPRRARARMRRAPRRRAPRTRPARARCCPAEVPADLLDLDPAASSIGKPPTPVPNATSASERAPSSSAAPACRGRRADDLGRGRAAKLHRRGVNHPARGHLARGRLDRLAQADRRALVALALDRGPPARAIAPATPPPWSSCVFAALAIASTSSVVMSASRTSTDGAIRRPR